MPAKNNSEDLGRLVNGFIRSPGQHGIEIGQTGTGKTQMLYYLIDGFVKFTPKSTIVWIDTGKTSEFLPLAKFRPLNLLIPSGCDIEIVPAEGVELDIKKTTVINLADIWRSLDPERINIISLSRFTRDHVTHAKIISKLFKTLIDDAYDYNLPVPLEIIPDEIQFLIPAKHVAYSYEHYQSGLNIVFSLFTLRSLKTRITGAAQDWGVINPAARNSFPWIFIRRGAQFYEGKLRRYNELWEKVPKGKAWIVYPTRDFSKDIINLPFYGDGEQLGRVYYHGKLTVEKKKKNIPNPGT